MVTLCREKIDFYVAKMYQNKCKTERNNKMYIIYTKVTRMFLDYFYHPVNAK